MINNPFEKAYVILSILAVNLAFFFEECNAYLNSVGNLVCALNLLHLTVTSVNTMGHEETNKMFCTLHHRDIVSGFTAVIRLEAGFKKNYLTASICVLMYTCSYLLLSTSVVGKDKGLGRIHAGCKCNCKL